MFNSIVNHAKQNSNVWIFSTMALSASLSLLAAFVLSVEVVQLAKNPDAALSCSLNAVINCASVMKHPSSDLFGFPNSYLGLIAEPIVLTLAVAGLAGVKFPRGFMAAAQIGYTAGLIFAYYLLYVSVFQIGALCPWCLLVTVSTTMVFASLTHYNIRENNLYLSSRVNTKLQSYIKQGYDKLIVASVLTAVAFLILFKYHDGLFG